MKKKAIQLSLAASLTLGATTIGTSNVFADKKNSIEVNNKYGTPSFIIEKEKYTSQVSTDRKSAVYSYLNSKKKDFYLAEDAKKEFSILQEKKDDSTNIYHYRLSQKYKNVPIYGFDQTLSLNKNNNVKTFFGQVLPNSEELNLNTSPKLQKNIALEVAQHDIEKNISRKVEWDKSSSPQLYIYEYKGKYYLAYVVKCSTSFPSPGYWHYFIDANNGNIINKYNAAEHINGVGVDVLGKQKTFQVTRQNSKYYLADETRGNGINTFNVLDITEDNLPLFFKEIGVTGLEVGSNTNHFNDPIAIDAHVNAEKVYDYYKEVFGRNSFDDEGSKINSVVHVGTKWNNAAWNGSQMAYGDGDGVKFLPLAASLDIVAHEITHAVTQYTAQLGYQGEPGALNESISDIMAVMVDRDNWEIGEDVYNPSNPNDSFRSLKDPASQGYPDHYSKRYIGTDDLGGVHTNASINNKAAYLISEGGTHYGTKVEGVGRKATEQIYYRALTRYLTSNSNFTMMRQAAIQSAVDLYGEQSKEVITVEKAYTAVGVE
ncbi:M4 family metallopeptidase [Priestia megaterium]|uniref:M4 family metallopeptidase n=1 Tax=Priestia megaterium TaxID=1404 RepID=UPI002877FB4F|nr:M4 family metallopeptidase [Priestia megaterium]MBX4163796.1 M4 family metallopeptidase [Priestia megaterium]